MDWFCVRTVELQANSLWKGVGVNNDGLSVSSELYLPLRSAESNHGLHCLGDDQFQEKTGQVSSAGTIWNVPLQVKDNWCKAYQILIPSLLAKGQTLTCFFMAGIPATWGRYFIPLLGLYILYILGVPVTHLFSAISRANLIYNWIRAHPWQGCRVDFFIQKELELPGSSRVLKLEFCPN